MALSHSVTIVMMYIYAFVATDFASDGGGPTIQPNFPPSHLAPAPAFPPIHFFPQFDVCSSAHAPPFTPITLFPGQSEHLRISPPIPHQPHHPQCPLPEEPPPSTLLPSPASSALSPSPAGSSSSLLRSSRTSAAPPPTLFPSHSLSSGLPAMSSTSLEPFCRACCLQW